MKIKNILSGMAAALVALALTGCYEKFDDPGEWVRYDDQWFIERDYSIQSIETVKKLFENPSKILVNHLKETDGDSDMYIPGASPTDPKTYGRYYLITEKYVIKGKVTSNDVYGNVYRSVFIQDEQGDGIEVKIGLGSMYSKYPIGETIYVICEGLALGNYRSMLSLGLKPTAEDYNDGRTEAYANKFIDVQYLIDKIIFRGDKTELEESDIEVIDASQPITDAQFMALAGKLVRIEGLVSKWVPGTSSSSSGYPSFLHKHGFNDYQTYNFEYAMAQWEAYRANGGTPPVMPEPQNNYLADKKPSWGFMEHGGDRARNFGSALFTMSGYTGSKEIIIRTSGYSRFALAPVTPDGTAVNVTGIAASYTDRQGSHPAYQITVDGLNDIVER